jgi:hypothetical protein
MSLDLNKLEKVREVGNGSVQARCPACAEAGQDRKGEHLRIQPDGKFGCCVFPQDRLHRKRIFALAGDNQPRIIKVRVQRSTTPVTIKDSVLGRLGRVFSSRAEATETKDESLGTLGTPLNPYTCSDENINSHKKLIGFGQSVPDVPSGPVQTESEIPVPSVPSCQRLPYFTATGDLVIPFDSPERYHWWKGGQSVAETRAELLRKSST